MSENGQKLDFKAFKRKCQNLLKFVEQMININLMLRKNDFSSSLGHNEFYMNHAAITPLLSLQYRSSSDENS